MDEFEKLLSDVLEQPHGLAVLCQSPLDADRMRRLLYLKRAKARERGVTEYEEISISFSPHAGDILYLYKKEVEDAAK